MSDEGGAWQRTEEGWAWMHSPDGRAWFGELARQGWERFFRGEMPPPPEWAIAPDVAPRIGDRVRLRETITSSNGTSASEGELMIVAGPCRPFRKVPRGRFSRADYRNTSTRGDLRPLIYGRAGPGRGKRPGVRPTARPAVDLSLRAADEAVSR
jgi:hypothetical protein